MLNRCVENEMAFAVFPENLQQDLDMLISRVLYNKYFKCTGNVANLGKKKKQNTIQYVKKRIVIGIEINIVFAAEIKPSTPSHSRDTS